MTTSFYTRVGSLPVVSDVLSQSLSAYTSAKEYNEFLNQNLAAVEKTLTGFLETETAKKTISVVDYYGNQQLDRINSARTTFQEEAPKYVQTVDTFLQHSTVGVPVTKFVTLTENYVGPYLPQVEEDKNTTAADAATQGPVIRAGQLTKRGYYGLTVTAPALVQPHKEASLKYCAELIANARAELERGITSTKASIESGSVFLKNKSEIVLQNEKLQVLLKQATTARVAAISYINEAIQQINKSKTAQTLLERYQTIRDRAHIEKLLAYVDKKKFVDIAQGSITELNAIGAKIMQAIKSPNEASGLIESARSQLLAVLHTLFGNIVEKQSSSAVAAEETPAPVEVEEEAEFYDATETSKEVAEEEPESAPQTETVELEEDDFETVDSQTAEEPEQEQEQEAEEAQPEEVEEKEVISVTEEEAVEPETEETTEAQQWTKTKPKKSKKKTRKH